MNRHRRETAEKYGPKPTTPTEALAHVVAVFADQPAHQLAITATDGIYDTTTGLTYGDLRSLHAELIRLRGANSTCTRICPHCDAEQTHCSLCHNDLDT